MTSYVRPEKISVCMSRCDFVPSLKDVKPKGSDPYGVITIDIDSCKFPSAPPASVRTSDSCVSSRAAALFPTPTTSGGVQVG